jgi:hypothetical protein
MPVAPVIPVAPIFPVKLITQLLYVVDVPFITSTFIARFVPTYEVMTPSIQFDGPVKNAARTLCPTVNAEALDAV